MNVSRNLLLVPLLLGLFLPCTAGVEKNVPSFKEVKTVTIDVDKSAVFGQPLQVIVKVQNESTNGTAIALARISIEPIGRLANYYKTYESREDPKLDQEGLTVSSGETKPFRMILTPTDDALWQSYVHTTQDYEILVVLRWTNNTIETIRYPVHMSSSPMAVVVGGIVGALLLAMFTHIYEFVNRPRIFAADSSNPWRAARDRIVPTLFRFWKALTGTVASTLMGGILAILIIALTRATSSVALPIAIKVDDFLGGLLVGMFSHILAPWLAERLNITQLSKTPEPSPATASSPGADDAPSPALSRSDSPAPGRY